MSSLFKWLDHSVMLMLGDGKTKSRNVGFVILLIDKVLDMIAKVLKS